MSLKFGKGAFVLIIISILNILIGFYILSDENIPYHYEMLPIFPIIQGLLCTLLIPLSKTVFDDVSKVIVFFLYSIRNTITPLFMSLGNYTGNIPIESASSVNLAIGLMLYETAAVFFFLGFSKERKKNHKKINKKKSYDKQLVIMKIFMIILILFCFISIIKIPQITDLYNSVFDPEAASKVLELIDETQIPVGGVDRILYTLTQVLIQFLRVFLWVWMISYLRKTLGDKLPTLALFMTIVLMFIQLLFIPAQAVLIIYILIVLSFVTLKLYPRQKKYVYFLVALIGISYVMTFALTKNSSNSISLFESTSLMLQAYIPGICNVAGISNVSNVIKFNTLFYDLYYMIPFRNSIFNYNGIDLAGVFNISNNVGGQILPNIAQSYFYLGFILSPITSIVLIKIGLSASRKAKNEDNIWKYSTYLLIMLYGTTMPATKNITLFGATMLTIILPMLILCKLGENRYTFSKILK